MRRIFLRSVYASVFLILVSLASACRTENGQTDTPAAETSLARAPTFNADSSMAFLKAQMTFGPRVPNTRAHVLCGGYLSKTLKKYGLHVIEQVFTPTTYDGVKLDSKNIIGSLNPSAATRIMLAAHWDSRPRADEDSLNPNKPVPAANDGASGVAVLLELARVMAADSLPNSLGIDFVLFDAEDWGDTEKASDEYGGYCLGSRYWAENKHVANYSAYYGVLLDMVGAKGATFPKEGYSRQYANDIVQNVWNTASRLGFSTYFIDNNGPAITDDHLPVNKIAKIPMIDIIHTNPNRANHTFFDQWHTTQDDLRQIDPNTLKAVGQTLIQVIYEEAQAK